MTRGTAYLFLGGNVIYSSIEFNGDMYFDDCGYGSEMMEAIKSCDTLEGFAEIVKEFMKVITNTERTFWFTRLTNI